jgi:hypothetical protein
VSFLVVTLITALGVGIAIVMFIKYLNYSTNPLWATTDSGSGGWNVTGLVLAAASLYEYNTRPASLFPAPPIDVEKDKPVAPVQSSRLQRTLITIGLGSLIHMLQTFLMDAGTIIAWTWTGYPVKGPTLHPFGGVVILVSALASTAATYSSHTPTFVMLWSIAGMGGSYTLLVYPDWLGFNGGMIFTAYFVSILPRLFRAASALPPGSTLGWALVVNILLDVASVITAAYAFVPMGWLLRERTDLVLGFCVVSIVAADFASLGLKLPGGDRLQLRSVRRIALTKRLNLLTAVIVAVLGLASSYRKVPIEKPVPYFPEHRLFSGGIFTVSTLRNSTVKLMTGAFWCRRARKG